MKGYYFSDYAAKLAAGRLLRVVNFHNTPQSAASSLRQYLAALSQDFLAIGQEELDAIFQTGQWSCSRPPLLLVFYEGYANNALVAAPILAELGLKAWFFLPTEFIDTPATEQEAFADAHSLGLVEEERGAGRLAMTWDEVASLAKHHVIAAHTATHREIHTITTEADLEREIFRPYRAILEATSIPPPATAFLYGSPLSDHPFVEDALRRAGYRYVFSNTRLQRIAAPRGLDCALENNVG